MTIVYVVQRRTAEGRKDRVQKQSFPNGVLGIEELGLRIKWVGSCGTSDRHGMGAEEARLGQ